MIERLRISDLGVIAEAEIELGPGLTVVTGETGAGKTMVVTALGLLLGARADSGRIRAGAAKAVVEGDFALPAAQADTVGERIAEAGGDIEEGVLPIVRILADTGRSRAVAGGRTVPSAVLGDVGERLVSVHGQTEQLTLRSPAAQRGLLDRFGGAESSALQLGYREAFRIWRDGSERLRELRQSVAQRQQRIQDLRTELEQIAEVRPEPGEDAELSRLSLRIGAHEELRQAASLAHDALAGGDDPEAVSAVQLVEHARRMIEAQQDQDPALESHQSVLADLAYRLSDSARELSAYLSDLGDPGDHDIEQIESRRALLGSLRAFGTDVDEVLEYERSRAEELLRLENDDAALGGMDDHVEALRASLQEAGEALRAHRRATAERLEAEVAEELSALAMPGAGLAVEISELDEPAQHGLEDVRIRLRQHPGAQPQDIAKTASGGELSRIMLALEVVIGAADPVPTFVFDEVDAGVGGRAAVEIGRRLARLARHSQVLVVTHLPQVAAWADAHVTVSKESGEGAPVSGVVALSDTEREVELARMLAGQDGSQAAVAHARELRETAREEIAAW